MDSRAIELALPYPPSVNHYYRCVGNRMLISREGRKFRKHVCSILSLAKIRPLAGPLHIEIDVFPPDRRRRDLDNVQKSLLDALEHGGAYEDDSQIVKLVVEKHDPVRQGKVTVRIGKV